MELYRPDYFDRFYCIAGDCPDSCCKEWAVQVDPQTAQYYLSLSGDLGDRLREVLVTEGGETTMTILDGRCPMWNLDGLCRIQLELGEASLCKVCREFPRLTHDYGDFVERGLELSCPAAAQWILSAQESVWLSETVAGGSEPDYDQEAMLVLKDTREKMLSLLSQKNTPVSTLLAQALLYGCQAQSELDSGHCGSFDPEATLEEAQALAKEGSMEEILTFFHSLELLTPQWKELLEHPSPANWEPRHLAFARYLVERYWLQAVSDYDLYSRVKFIIIACLLVRHLGGDLIRTAQLFSKEIENDLENVEAILDGAYTCPAFRDDRLLGLLLQK